jgi:hypothetical protein
MLGSHLFALILLAVSSSIYDILVVATKHHVNKSKTVLTRKMSARAKNCEKSACAIEKAQHLNKNHPTIQNFYKI